MVSCIIKFRVAAPIPVCNSLSFVNECPGTTRLRLITEVLVTGSGFFGGMG